MRKFLLLVLEINSLVFAWYVVMGLAIIGIDMATGGLLQGIGITRTMIGGIIGASALLKTLYAILGMGEKPRIIRSLTLARIRELASFCLVLACIAWGSFWYGEARAVAELAAGGIVPAWTIGAALALILFVGAVMNAREGDPDERESDENPETAGTQIKEKYGNREESSLESGKGKAFPLWRHAHETEYASIVARIPAGKTVLDDGCGDGTLAIMLAKKGAIVTACDISGLNIEKAKRHAEEAGIAPGTIAFRVADAERLPFEDASFDWVVSAHVLEHLPDFSQGLAEVRRVTKRYAVIAMPTCLNPCAAVILGGDVFWTVSRWSPFAWFIGIGRIFLNIGGEGVDEGYRGDRSLPHIWRYPHVMKRRLRDGGFRIISFEASSLCLPYANALIPALRKIERYKTSPILRNFGYGSIAVVEK